MRAILPEFYEAKDQMKEDSSRIVSHYCSKTRIYQSGINYYQIGCYNPECSFRISYSHRSSKYNKDGYYLIEKSTCLDHINACQYNPKVNQFLDDPQIQAQKVLFMFENKIPSISNIKDVLHALGVTNISKNRLEYVKMLCKEIIFSGAKDSFSQVYHYCDKLKNNGWKIEYDFEQGFLTTISVFPPWAPVLISYYGNPIQVDLTFSKQKLRFNTGTLIDGEKKILPFGLVIRPTEDSKGYMKLFDFVNKYKSVKIITIISDMAKCINKAAKTIFDKYHCMWCLYHLIQNVNNKYNFKPLKDLWRSFKQACMGIVSENDVYHLFLDEESYNNIECLTTEYIFNDHLIPSFSQCCHRRLCISSSNEESLNAIIKKNGNDSLSMIKQFVMFAKNSYENLISRNYKENAVLTNYAEKMMNKLIILASMNNFDQSFHDSFLRKETICCYCTYYKDSGFPCCGMIKKIIEKQENPYCYCNKVWSILKHFSEIPTLLISLIKNLLYYLEKRIQTITTCKKSNFYTRII